MSVAPPRKKSRAVFWIAAIVIGSIILATALLANDMRNLRALDTRYHLNLFSQPLPLPAPPAAAIAAPQAANVTHPAPTPAATSAPAPAKPVKAVQAAQTVKPVHARPSSHMLDPPVDALRGAFVRSWRISGQTLCASLVKSGLPVGEWKQSVLGVGTFECSYAIQKGIYGDPDAASLFIIARGAPTGELTNIRIKVIMPDSTDGRAIAGTFIDTIVLLLSETHWLDFQTALDNIGKLQDLTQDAFGARLSFLREFQSSSNFNFQLELRRTAPEQIRTAIVFDKARWTLQSAPPDN